MYINLISSITKYTLETSLVNTYYHSIGKNILWLFKCWLQVINQSLSHHSAVIIDQSLSHYSGVIIDQSLSHYSTFACHVQECMQRQKRL